MAGSTKTIEQQLAELDAKRAGLLEKQRKLDTGQKVILGGLLLSEAKEDPRIRDWLVKQVAEKVTRKADTDRLEPLIAELKALGIGKGEQKPSQQPPVRPQANTSNS